MRWKRFRFEKPLSENLVSTFLSTYQLVKSPAEAESSREKPQSYGPHQDKERPDKMPGLSE
jgi:hypothetical protein